jgi:hypothetical protein
MRTSSVVLAASLIVYCGTSITLLADQDATPAQVKASPATNTELPPNVREMREMILAAVHSGKLEDLAPAIEQNELPPEFGSDAKGDAIAQLKSMSVDGSGVDLLALLGDFLDTEPAKLPIGRDHENNIVFVWPGLSERPLDQLTPAEQVTLYRLMSSSEAKALIGNTKWPWWRLAIGSDGTWLTFMKPKPSK